jgi:hypothetical protein
VPFQFFHGRAKPHTQGFRQSRVRLLQRQRLGNHADLLAAARIQPFPKLPLAAAVSPQPLFSGPRWAACLRFAKSIVVLFLRLNNDARMATAIALTRLLHESPVTSSTPPASLR